MQNNELRGLRQHLADAEAPEKVVELGARDGTIEFPRDSKFPRGFRFSRDKKLPTLVGSNAATDELLDLPPPRYPARLIPDST